MGIYKEEHDIFRGTVKKFIEKEVLPNIDEWEEKGEVPRSLWKKCGEMGFLGMCLDEKYGGLEVGFEYTAVLVEEFGKVNACMPVVGTGDILAPYIRDFGTEELKMRYLSRFTKGDLIPAIAMTEPNTGSDLKGVRTSAISDGDDYIINGQKTFITNGNTCDMMIVVCKTNPDSNSLSNAFSLIIVDDGTTGFIKGRKLNKMGMHMQDTAEIFFEDCHVPKANLIGEEGKGFGYLMSELQKERLVMVMWGQAMAEAMLQMGIDYAKSREAFGQPIATFQHNAFKIADMATQVQLGRSLINELIIDFIAGKDIVVKVSMAKLYVGEMANNIAAKSFQLHGGYGFMEEYPIARYYRDIRAMSVYAGSSEIMRLVIARSLGIEPT